MKHITTRRSRPFARLRALASVALIGAIAIAATAGSGSSPAASPLASTFAAHGGLDRLQMQGQMSYTMRGFPLSAPMAKPNRSTVDLRTRRNRIDGDGFTVGFDGARAWSVPNPEAVGLPPRFVTLGSFYFIGMPFVFGDDGVVLENAGTATFRDKTYRVINVGYERGTGHTSKDDYVAFIDTSTNRLALINHSVTETGVERVTWTFDEWQEVDGLLVPARMTFYAGWNPDDPGDGASFTVEDVRFSRETPGDRLYAAPADAVIDDSPDLH